MLNYYGHHADAIKIRDIQNVVAKNFGVTVEDLKSEKRMQPLARYRQVAMYLARGYTTASYPVIGRAFRRDHTTVLHAERRIGGLLKYDLDTIAQITLLNVQITEQIQRCVHERCALAAKEEGKKAVIEFERVSPK